MQTQEILKHTFTKHLLGHASPETLMIYAVLSEENSMKSS